MKNIDKLIKAIYDLNIERVELIDDKGGSPSFFDEDAYFLSECIDDLIIVCNDVVKDRASKEKRKNVRA